MLREPNQIRQPIFVNDVPRIMTELISKNQTGVFHLAGPDRIKIIDFLKRLEGIFREDSLVSVAAETVPSQLKIPFNATFDTSKTKSLGIGFTDMKDGLNLMKERLNQD